MNYFDDLTLNIHILYDDCMVLPQPESAVPEVLHHKEVTVFEDLERALDSCFETLAIALTPTTYRIRAGWLVHGAQAALAVMQACDESGST